MSDENTSPTCSTEPTLHEIKLSIAEGSLRTFKVNDRVKVTNDTKKNVKFSNPTYLIPDDKTTIVIKIGSSKLYTVDVPSVSYTWVDDVPNIPTPTPNPMTPRTGRIDIS